MKSIFQIIILCVILISFFIMVSCTTDEKTIEITDIGWFYENIDTSYWTDSFDDATLFSYFEIVYEGSDISLDDIEYAVFIHDSLIFWSFPLDEDHFYPDNKLITSYSNYSTNWSSNGSVLPIGPINFEVKLTNGHRTIYIFNVPAPGSTSTNGKEYVYNEDYASTVLSSYTPMIPRANISSGSKTSTIDITFSVSDPNVFNGYILFYDTTNNYVGISEIFRDWESGDLSTVMNGGIVFNVNGIPNSIQLSAGNIVFESGYDFNDIDHFHLVLTDGFQHLNKSFTYDYKSISVRRYF